MSSIGGRRLLLRLTDAAFSQGDLLSSDDLVVSSSTSSRIVLPSVFLPHRAAVTVDPDLLKQ